CRAKPDLQSMRIAIVNDLSLAREVLRRLVLSVPGYSVAWFAEDGDEAIKKTATDCPDVILMDLVMPRVNGVEATCTIMKQTPCPILVVTSTVKGHYDLAIAAINAGALDAVETPILATGGTIQNGQPLLNRLAKLADANRGVTYSGLRVPLRPKAPPCDAPPLVIIGSSTGGPDALATVLAAFPQRFPAAILIAQHIAAEFAPTLATWLGERCTLPVRTARAGDSPTAGTVLLAESNDHLEIGSDHKVRYTASPRQYPYRPSIDVLFESAAAIWPRLGVGVLLTGMGSDGADGLLRLRGLGWHTIAQDESTCVVYGMPKAAAEKQAATEILPLSQIGPTIAAKILGKKLR
ncbi:MAG TPA: chemotaxis-specific protein-glutamate methyltransferase CheB, partial [Gemmata sp.]|nr:chemotaxis-specific protein-glutamate methyltransferase CheB [Gemmata sp.]